MTTHQLDQLADAPTARAVLAALKDASYLRRSDLPTNQRRYFFYHANRSTPFVTFTHKELLSMGESFVEMVDIESSNIFRSSPGIPAQLDCSRLLVALDYWAGKFLPLPAESYTDARDAQFGVHHITSITAPSAGAHAHIEYRQPRMAYLSNGERYVQHLMYGSGPVPTQWLDEHYRHWETRLAIGEGLGFTGQELADLVFVQGKHATLHMSPETSAVDTSALLSVELSPSE